MLHAEEPLIKTAGHKVEDGQGGEKYRTIQVHHAFTQPHVTAQSKRRILHRTSYLIVFKEKR